MPRLPTCRRLGSAAAIMLMSSPAIAVDWSISGFLSQRVTGVAGDTSQNTTQRDDQRVESLTDLGATVTALTKTTRWILSPGVRAAIDTDRQSDLSKILPRFNGGVTHQEPRYVLSANLSIVPELTSDSQFEDTGVVDRDVLQITGAGNLGLRYLFDEANTLSFGAFGRVREFTDSTSSLDANRSFGINGAYSRQATATTSVGLTPSLTFFYSDAPTGADGQTLSVTADVSHRVNERFDVSASFGPAFTQSERQRAAPGGGFVTESDNYVSAIGRIAASYRTAQADYSLSLQQGVDQNSDGDLETRTSLSGAVSHAVNERSRLRMNISAGVQTPLTSGGDDRQTLSIVPSYTYDVTENWSVNAGYRFRAANETSTKTSNAVFIQISRGLSLLP